MQMMKKLEKTLTNGASNWFQRLASAQEKSKVAWESAYPLILNIPQNGTAQQSFYVSGQGDFCCEYLTGKIYAYDPANGNTIVSAITTGVTFQINESGNNRDIFQAALNAETILTPGYGSTIYEKHNMRDYVFKATSTIRVSAWNANATYPQILELCFSGHQSNGSV